MVINRIRLDGFIYCLESSLQLHMCRELQIFTSVHINIYIYIYIFICVCVCVFGCKSSLFRLCGSDFGITPVDDITIGIT